MNNMFICICTYKRPEALQRLLASLRNITLINQKNIGILIVDNDPDGSSKNIVEKIDSVIYFIETERGISSARNRCISEAKKLSAEWIIFLDDDEIATETWLESLLYTQLEFNARIVCGPVITNLPSHLSIYRSFMTRSRHANGTKIYYFGAGNLLVNMGVFEEVGGFSLDYSFSGGEDTHFSARCQKMGIDAIWSDNAIIYEPIDLKRANDDWIIKRALNSSIIIGRVEKELFKHKVMRRFIIGSVLIILGILMFPVEVIANRLHMHKTQLTLRKQRNSGLGMVLGTLGIKKAFY
ncbi:glycosyltransferase family 2 protein [Deinococcus ruber]|uniref:Glycosyl transferase family A n=1 Tax=Deinococcus ruber TaxID=1848197 RepID=A0A918FC05_9DEIO|nr:glycosyltransferase family 2 protein [Deinococcus ruber]GGR29242.1 glycosyl transferase family A [Deinococcus ruber]